MASFSDDEMLCPITLDVMATPVIASDGKTYEKRAIKEWLRKRMVSPLTNLPITNELIPNVKLRQRILDKYPELQIDDKKVRIAKSNKNKVLLLLETNPTKLLDYVDFDINILLDYDGYISINLMFHIILNSSNIESYKSEILLLLCRRPDSVEIIKYMFSSLNIDINEINIFLCFVTSFRNGHHAAIEYFISNGISINILNKKGYENENMLHYLISISTLDYNIFELLMKYKIDLTHKCNGWTVFHRLVSEINFHPEYIEIIHIMASKIDINVETDHGWSPMFLACEKGSVPVINLLLENGADINKLNNLGQNVLDYMIINNKLSSYNNYQILELFIRYNIDLTHKCDGWTAFHRLISKINDYRYFELINYIIPKIDISVETDNGWSPIFLACETNNLELVKLLVEHGANIDKPNILDELPLHTACSHSTNIDLISYLIDKTSNVNHKDKANNTPLLCIEKRQDLDDDPKIYLSTLLLSKN